MAAAAVSGEMALPECGEPLAGAADGRADSSAAAAARADVFSSSNESCKAAALLQQATNATWLLNAVASSETAVDSAPKLGIAHTTDSGSADRAAAFKVDESVDTRQPNGAAVQSAAKHAATTAFAPSVAEPVGAEKLSNAQSGVLGGADPASALESTNPEATQQPIAAGMHAAANSTLPANMPPLSSASTGARAHADADTMSCDKQCNGVSGAGHLADGSGAAGSGGGGGARPNRPAAAAGNGLPAPGGGGDGDACTYDERGYDAGHAAWEEQLRFVAAAITCLRGVTECQFECAHEQCVRAMREQCANSALTVR